MTTIRTVIQDRRIDVPAPSDLPDGTEVFLTVGTTWPDDGPVSPEEIERVLAAMRQLEPLDLPDDIAANLNAWENKLNQYGIAHAEKGLEEVFP